jgi:hypothetical protein
MAAMSASWSAGHHLSALSNLASKLERLERQAELLDNLQEEENGRVGFQALTLLKWIVFKQSGMQCLGGQQ